MSDNYYLKNGVALVLPISFGVQHSYRTRCPKHYTAILRCRLSFTKRFFRCQAIHWWNTVPSKFFMVLLFPATYLNTLLISLNLYIWFYIYVWFYGCICFTALLIFLLCVVISNCDCICTYCMYVYL